MICRVGWWTRYTTFEIGNDLPPPPFFPHRISCILFSNFRIFRKYYFSIGQFIYIQHNFSNGITEKKKSGRGWGLASGSLGMGEQLPLPPSAQQAETTFLAATTDPHIQQSPPTRDDIKSKVRGNACGMWREKWRVTTSNGFRLVLYLSGTRNYNPNLVSIK